MNVAHPPGAPLEIAVRLIQVIVPASGRGTAKPAKSLDRQEERSMSRMLFLMPLMALATPAAAAESPAAYLGQAGAGDLFEQTSSKIVLETTSDARVKSFAHMMIGDHGKSTAMLTSSAENGRASWREGACQYV